MNKTFVQKINLQLHAEESEGIEKPEQPNSEKEPKGDEKESNGKPEAKYTDEDVNRIINEKFAKWEEKQKSKTDEAARLAQMNAQEKAEYERDKLQKQIDELLRDKSLSEMQSTARDMLSSANINASDDIVKMLVSDDAEKTKNTVNAFVSLFNESVKNAVAEALKGKSPKLGNTGETLTKKDIMAIKDTKARQKAIKENIELFQ